MSIPRVPSRFPFPLPPPLENALIIPFVYLPGFLPHVGEDRVQVRDRFRELLVELSDR